MLIVKNINKSYKNKQVLKDVSITFEKGLYGLLGENGAGKTTLINVLTGLLLPESGEVIYNDKNIRNRQCEYRKNLGYMPQYATYYPNFTANEFMQYICALKGIPKKQQKAQIEEFLQKVNLYEERKNKIGTFSGGMRQRLGIAQAIINDPDVLILDEPTAGLDPGERIRFRELIQNLAVDRTILLATHIISDVEEMADQVIILHAGKIAAKGRPDELVSQSGCAITSLEDFFK